MRCLTASASMRHRAGGITPRHLEQCSLRVVVVMRSSFSCGWQGHPRATSWGRDSVMWPALEAIAHTLAYDAACLGDGLPPTARLATITQPVLVSTGGGNDFFEQAADAVAASVPRGERLTFEGQPHTVDPKAMAAVLERFLGG